MSANILPYDPRWVTKLLRRDMHNLKTKITKKIKARFSSSPSPCKALTHPREQFDVVIVEPDRPRSIESTVSSTRSEQPHTLYELLEDHLWAVWASRDCDVSHKDRWQFRGSWLVLWMALQTCPSNACYNVFKGPNVDETELLLELDGVKESKASQRVSKMPAAPFEGVRDHVRYDSAISGGASRPTLSQLWRGIMEGAIDASRMTLAAEELLSCVWPGENTAEILDIIGDPSKQFRNDDELRDRLRDVLFPSYTMLSSPRRC